MKIKLITMAKEVSNQGYITKLHKIPQNTGFKELLGTSVYSWGVAAPGCSYAFMSPPLCDTLYDKLETLCFPESCELLRYISQI